MSNPNSFNFVSYPYRVIVSCEILPALVTGCRRKETEAFAGSGSHVPPWTASGRTREIARALEQGQHRFLWSLCQPPSKGKMEYPSAYANLEHTPLEGFLDQTAPIRKDVIVVSLEKIKKAIKVLMETETREELRKKVKEMKEKGKVAIKVLPIVH
ncbi:hypothetical protein CRG98_043466 [Punica granatum]|uniref:Uncharacterized protein n=1 Tax=Punica granatum TaxID=22663 RepID=A0A2I0HWS6_PUNGR|nr:hypothetical protein CRG98_043466 [Punica granatum]